ncbi:MAG TPA: hypothetical protein VJC39_05400 [Candidatus Nanoarchaeia archaeon]|nr:hypothetical protein [Candidatus Nanoarchaeia archaeon]
MFRFIRKKDESLEQLVGAETIRLVDDLPGFREVKYLAQGLSNSALPAAYIGVISALVHGLPIEEYISRLYDIYQSSFKERGYVLRSRFFYIRAGNLEKEMRQEIRQAKGKLKVV